MSNWGLEIYYLNNQENPEHEILINDILDIKKIYILNLALKDRDSKDNLSGAKYIINENSGLLNVYCTKYNTGNDYDNLNYYAKIIALQAISESFKCDEIKITGNFRVKGIQNFENMSFKDLVIGHATYNLEDSEVNVKLKIASFCEYD